jgi:Holliday junction resolvase RusA-like endonuclease
VQWGYECNAWALTQLPALAALRLMAAQKQPLHVHVRFWFPQSDIWTKEGEVKKLDPPNFLKLIIDNVAAYASMDDSLFFHVSCEKRPHPNPANTHRLTDLTIDYYK